MIKANPLVEKLTSEVAAALNTYSSSQTDDITAGIYLTSYARKGYIAPTDPADAELLQKISSWAMPSAPVYDLLRKAREGL